MSKTTTQNLAQVTPSELVVSLNKLLSTVSTNIRLGKKRFGIYVWGGAGAGKSAIVAELARSKNYKLIDLRLPQTDPTDLRGIPVPFKKEELDEMVVQWATPEIFPRADAGVRTATIKKNVFELTGEEGESEYFDGAIVFLDELSNAPPMVQNAAYQLVLDGELGSYRLPDNVFVIAAGNRREDKGGTFEMLGPLKNRFYHLELKVKWEDFFNHAIDKKFHPAVVSYLDTHRADLNNFDSKSSSYAFASPRSWEAASNVLNDDVAVPDSVLTAIICGTVGDTVGNTFLTHFRNSIKLPNPTGILNGEIKRLDQKLDASLQRALAISLCYQLKELEDAKKLETKKNGDKKIEALEDEFFKKVDNFFGFIQDNFAKELIGLSAKIFFSNYAINLSPKKVPQYRERFTRDYKDMLFDAIQQ